MLTSIPDFDRQQTPQTLAACQAALAQRTDELAQATQQLQQERTLRQVLESQVQEQADLLQSTYKGVSHGVILIDIPAENEFRFFSWNAVIERTTGIASETAAGQSPEELFGADQGAEIRQNFQRCVAANDSITYEECISLHGQDHWFLTRLMPLLDAQGQIYRIVLTTFDISERKAIEMALQIKEAEYRSIFESINDGIIINDLETGKVVAANPAMCEIHGYTYEEFMQLEPTEIVHPNSLAKFGQFMAASKAGERYTCVAADLHEDGSVIDVEIKSVPFFYGGTPHGLAIVRDVSERKAAEAALKKTNALLNSVIETIPGFFFAKDRQGRHIALNSNLAKFLGRPIAEILGKTDAELLPAEIAAEIMAKDREIMTAGQPQCFEETIERAGTEATYLTSKTPLRDLSGNVIGLIGLAQDISDRKAIEISLQRSEQRFRDVTEAAGEYIWEITAEGKYTFVSERSKAVKGHSPTELLGHTPFEFMPADDIPAVEAIVQTAAANRSAFQLEHRNILPSGEMVWESVSGVPILDSDGNISGFRGTGLSITERKAAEAAIAESEAKFRRLVEDADDVIYAVDLEGRFTYLSPQFHSLWGYNVEAFLHQSLISLVHPGDLTRVMASNQVLFSTGQKQTDLEFRVKHQQSDRWLWVTCNNSPILNAEGDVVGFQGIARDITAQKQSELAVQQKAQELEGALKALQTTQLQMIQSEKMSSLGQLVAGVAHEINNPVSFIYGNIKPANDYATDLLNLVALYQQYYPTPADEIQAEIEQIDLGFLQTDLPKTLTSMKMGAERIREIVSSLRTFSRLDEAACKSVDIHTGIDSSLVILEHRLKPTSARPAIQVVKEYGTLPAVECFAGQLNQVVINILTNALDAMEDRDRTRTPADMAQSPSTLTITTQPVGADRIAIQIADNGPGIPADVKARIFDPFFTTKPVGKGTGMGMSISYQIITENHGGRLRCETSAAGTTFIIEIPRRQPAADESR
ncbi:MAG: PAS domain S-box protein [Cyanobacteria bacterium P01_D01_bin.14]